MLPVGIIGGGIGGLAAAARLRHLGVPSRVFERRTPDNYGKNLKSDYAITLKPPAIHFLQQMGVPTDEIRNNSVLMERHSFVTSAGRILLNRKEFAEKAELPETRTVKRSWLEQRLAAEVAPGAVQLGSAFESLHVGEHDGPVRVQLRGGASARFSALVAADGAHSALRRVLLPRAAEVFVGYAFISSPPLPQKDLLKLTARACTWLPETPELLMTMPETADFFRWHFAFRTKEVQLQKLRNLGSEKWLDFVRDRISRWPLPLDSLMDATAPLSNQLELRGAHQHLPAELAPMCTAPFVWGDKEIARPRVALIGDAAQKLPPLGGVGANAAIEDGYETAELLAKAYTEDAHDWQAAIAAANNGIVVRCVPNLRYCRLSAASQLPQKPIHAYIRNAILPWLNLLPYNIV